MSFATSFFKFMIDESPHFIYSSPLVNVTAIFFRYHVNQNHVIESVSKIFSLSKYFYNMILLWKYFHVRGNHVIGIHIKQRTTVL